MIEPWQWLAFGMLLILAEIFLPSFTALWFGLGASLVALILWLYPTLSFEYQLFGWALFSTVATVAWFKYFRQTMKDRTTAGIAQEAIRGEIGYVLKIPTGERHGLARFTPALLGDDEWPFILLEDHNVHTNSDTANKNNNHPPSDDTTSTDDATAPEHSTLVVGDKVIVQNITGNTLIVIKKT